MSKVAVVVNTGARIQTRECLILKSVFLTADLSYTLCSLLVSQIYPGTFLFTSSAEMLLLSIVFEIYIKFAFADLDIFSVFIKDRKDLLQWFLMMTKKHKIQISCSSIWGLGEGEKKLI